MRTQIIEEQVIAQKLTNKMNKTRSGIDPKSFDTVIDGKQTRLLVLTNARGMEIAITNYGARIVSAMAEDESGSFDDIILGFKDLDGYRSQMDQAFGATIGRFANRIGNAAFELDGQTFSLDANDQGNSLHSGSASWMHVVWDIVSESPGHVTFQYSSPNGEGGFPGAALANVTFSLSDDNTLRIRFFVSSDDTTVANITQHAYFNLAGESSGNIENHVVEVNANEVTEISKDLVPTGSLIDVADTALDLTTPVRIGDRIHSNDAHIQLAYGFDHNFVLSKKILDPAGLSFAAKVIDVGSGRTLQVWTDQPGMQLYTGNSIHDGIIGKSGMPYCNRAGLCLETQHFPDSPNHPSFPSTVVSPDNEYDHICEYRFGTVSSR